MKVNKWVAVLATCSVLAVTAPVSAQFGGLGALKKKLETVAKELETKTSAATSTNCETNAAAVQSPNRTRRVRLACPNTHTSTS